MIDRTRRVSARPDPFPARLRDWLEEYDDLLGGIVVLRRLPDSDTAVEAVLAVREVRKARLSWELWEALLLGEGDDPDRLLLGRVPFALLDRARRAFWGDPIAVHPPRLRIVEPE